MKRFYIVPHTHWDREWHKTYQENRVRLIGFMDELLDIMEKDSEFIFMLDGQTSLLPDYLEIKPENAYRLKALISSGRLTVGPWYVQPDENIPSGEALIRNLLISKVISDEFGGHMKCGYLPDSFGQSADMPTILKSFGINGAMFYRGMAKEDLCYDVFLWEGLDGSQVTAAFMPSGYGNAMFLKPGAENSLKVVEAIREAQEARLPADMFLLMCGSDQCYPKPFLTGLCARLEQLSHDRGLNYEFKLCSAEDYISSMHQYKSKLPVYSGEMRKGKHSRTHISISGGRPDIKKANFTTENLYKNILEPLYVIASSLGLKYPSSLINRGWRYIVENHAHDSICCCCTDDVHEEMLTRLKYAAQIGNTLLEEAKTFIFDRIQYRESLKPLLLMSSYAGHRRELVETVVYSKSESFSILDNSGKPVDFHILSREQINLKDSIVSLMPVPDDWYYRATVCFYAEIEGFGYTTYYIDENRPGVFDTERAAINNVMENPYIKVTVEINGTLTILDKQTGRCYSGQGVYMDGGNAGDEYDYSPPVKDEIVLSVNRLKSISTVENHPLRMSMRLTYIMDIPSSCDGCTRSEELVPIEIVTVISITADDNFVDFETQIDNQADNHRIQVLFKINEPVHYHTADIQLGEITRENRHTQTIESEAEWCERYYPIYTHQKYVSLADSQGYGFMLANKGLPQYEIKQDGNDTSVALTLLSSVGRMGNENLVYRKGRRSGSVCETPKAQMKGISKSEYRFIPISSGTVKNALAECYVNPIFGFTYPQSSGGGIVTDKLYTVQHDGGAVLSALKRAENGDGYIARFYNPEKEPLHNVELFFNRHLFTECRPVDSSEEPADNEAEICSNNNPDDSDKPKFNGLVRVKNWMPHKLLSFRLNSRDSYK